LQEIFVPACSGLGCPVFTHASAKKSARHELANFGVLSFSWIIFLKDQGADSRTMNNGRIPRDFDNTRRLDYKQVHLRSRAENEIKSTFLLTVVGMSGGDAHPRTSCGEMDASAFKREGFKGYNVWTRRGDTIQDYWRAGNYSKSSASSKLTTPIQNIPPAFERH